MKNSFQVKDDKVDSAGTQLELDIHRWSSAPTHGYYLYKPKWFFQNLTYVLAVKLYLNSAMH